MNGHIAIFVGTSLFCKLPSPRFCLDHAAQVAVYNISNGRTVSFKRHGFEHVAFVLCRIFSFHIPTSKFFKSRIQINQWTSENFEVSFGEGVG